MNEIAFTQQVKAMSNRLTLLYQGINTSSSPLPTLLPSALKELGIAAERLEAASVMLDQQKQKLLLANQTAATSNQRYQELLDFIPDAYLLTDATGKIQEANQAAAKLLNLKQSILVGRSITALMTRETQPQFQTQLQRLQQWTRKQEWQIRLQPYQGVPFNVTALVEVSYPEPNQPLTIRWLLRHAEQSDSNIDLSYPSQYYHKGETIPLDPHVILQVRSGLVKLTTFAHSGQEVLVGLAGAKAPFGPGLTALPLYEATALSDTQVSYIPLTKFTTSPELKQSLLSQVNERLKQAELLLAIYGQPRVVDRLHSLLKLLKQEIGQPVADGTRLSVRLTHADLAAACCTTRVSITRLLSKLQQQNKLLVDSQHHLILKL